MADSTPKEPKKTAPKKKSASKKTTKGRKSTATKKSKSKSSVKNLVIVESPAKAKTIEGFLGKDYLVKSSFGHVRDLSKKNLSVEVDKNFEPLYEISADKTKVIKELKRKTRSKMYESLQVVRKVSVRNRRRPSIHHK